MMQRLRQWVVCLAVCGCATPAWAALLDTTTSLARGGVDLGLEVQGGAIGAYETGPTPISLNLHEAIGLANGLDLQLQEGFGLADPHEVYIGGAIKWTVLHDSKDRPGVALYFGGHYIANNPFSGADATVIVDHRFNRFTPYGGARYNIEFGDGQADSFLGLLAGCRIGLHKKVGWIVEGGLGLVGPVRSNYLATGPRINI